MNDKRSDISNERIIEALELTGAVLVDCAGQLGINRNTLRIWIDADKELQKAEKQASSLMLDLGESVLMHHLHNNDLTAAIYVTKTRGKHKYSERQEVTGKDGKNILTFADLAKKAAKD